MGRIIELSGWRERKAVPVELAPALACPICEVDCNAVNATDDGSTVY
jgi:hypothetical protein